MPESTEGVSDGTEDVVRQMMLGEGVQQRRGNVQFQAIRHDLSLLSFLYQS
jgi:hypothetical protein